MMILLRIEMFKLKTGNLFSVKSSLSFRKRIEMFKTQSSELCLIHGVSLSFRRRIEMFKTQSSKLCLIEKEIIE